VKHPGPECRDLNSPQKDSASNLVAYGILEKWNNGDKSGIQSDFIPTAVPRILNRSQSIKPNIPVFHYSNTPWP
jgi:hypothetical protein